MVGAIGQLAQEKVELSNRLDVLETDKARKIVRKMIKAGKLPTHQADVAVKLYMADRESYEALLVPEPAGEPA